MRREKERGQIFVIFLASCRCARERSERKLERRAGECERPSTEVRLPPSPNPSLLLFFFPTLPVPSAFGVSRVRWTSPPWRVATRDFRRR